MSELLDETATRSALGHLGRTKLYELTRDGSIRSVKIGRRRFWPAAAVAAYVERLECDHARHDARRAV